MVDFNFDQLKKLAETAGVSAENVTKLDTQLKLLSKNDANKAIQFLTDSYTKFIAVLRNEGPASAKKFFETLVEQAEKGVAAIGSLSDGFASLIHIFDVMQSELTKGLAEIQSGLKSGTNSTFEMAGSMALLTAAAAGLNGSQAFSEMGLHAEAATKKITGVLDTVNKLSGGGGLTEAATKAMGNLLEAAEYSKQFENLVMTTAAKSGSLTPMQIDVGPASKQLDLLTNSIQQAAYRSAKDMGMSYETSLKQTMDLLAALPESINRLYDNGLTGKSIGAMELLQTVARGTGQSFETVTTIASSMFSNFGTDAESAAKRASILSSVSQDLKIPFEELNSKIKSIDENFKQWGNSANSTLTILQQVSGVLKEQGVGYSAQLQIVEQLTGAIKGMSFEKKAFIGMESGIGGSAIHAGLEVESVMQGGDLGKITSMLQTTLGNIGGTNGHIVSLDEARNSPGQEGAFMAQRKALEMFGVSDTGTQNRLMEVMSKVSLGSELNIDEQKALKDTFKAGANIQERQYNKLEQIYTETVTMRSIAASRKAYDESQKIVGNADETNGRANRTNAANDGNRVNRDNVSAEGQTRTALSIDNTLEEAEPIVNRAVKWGRETGSKVTARINNTLSSESRAVAEEKRKERQRKDAAAAETTANDKINHGVMAAMANEVGAAPPNVYAEAVKSNEQHPVSLPVVTPTIIQTVVNANETPKPKSDEKPQESQLTIKVIGRDGNEQKIKHDPNNPTSVTVR